MRFIGLFIIGFLLAMVDVCVINFNTNTFDGKDTLIVLCCVILWSMLCSAIEEGRK